MATRLLLASLPKTHSKTKTSQHLTPFSAVAAPLFLRISRLEASRILETIYEEETALISTGESIKGVADQVVTSASFLVANRSTCFGQMKKQLSNNSDKVFPMCLSKNETMRKGEGTKPVANMAHKEDDDGTTEEELDWCG
ncbi:hypothetical protein L1987_59254 [Smallanthus sonchifolius]|uniref:Uncharacterized protein n=1 Tax=Smallanthus sonchifolius TaxID=185202 RepID=A0ACB9D502_9ASTR|nr:hypothetical protein L1987_59254 [Smallanthus sonchifolius]